MGRFFCELGVEEIHMGKNQISSTNNKQFQIYDLEKELTASWSYSTQLFLEPTIEFFKKEFLFILDSFLNHPTQTIENIFLSKKNEVSQSVKIEFSF